MSRTAATCSAVKLGSRPRYLNGWSFTCGSRRTKPGDGSGLGGAKAGQQSTHRHQRRGTYALNRARRLAVDDAGRLGRNEEVHLRADAVLLALDVAVEQKAGEPAATDADPIAREDRPKFRHAHGKAAASLHAGEARPRSPVAGAPQD